MELDAVEAGLAGSDRAVDELLLYLVDFFIAEIFDSLLPACADGLLDVVDELERHLAAFGVYRVGHLFQSGNELVVAYTEKVRALSVEDAAGFDVDKSEAALRARNMALDELVGDEADFVRHAGDCREPHETVSEFEIPKFYRL